MFSLHPSSLFIFPLYVYFPSIARGKGLAERLGNVEKLNPEDQMVSIQDPRKIVIEEQKFVESDSMIWRRKQANLAERVSGALVNYEEHRRDHHEKLKLVSNKGLGEEPFQRYKKSLPKGLVRAGCTLAMFCSGTRFTDGDQVSGKRNDEVWV